MIITLTTGLKTHLLPESIVTLKKEIIDPGPYKVEEIDAIKGAVKLAGLDDFVSPDSIESIDNSNVGFQEVDVGGGSQDLVLPQTAQVIKEMQELVVTLQNGEQVKQLMAEVDALKQELLQSNEKLPKLLESFPKGVSEALANFEKLLYEGK